MGGATKAEVDPTSNRAVVGAVDIVFIIVVGLIYISERRGGID